MNRHPPALLVLVKARPVFGQQTTLPIVGNDEREHPVEWHEDQVIVAIRVTRVASWMAVDLGDDAQAVGTGGAGGSAGSLRVSHDELRTASAWRTVTAEHEGVVVDLPPEPPDEALVRRLPGARLFQELAGAVDHGLDDDEAAARGTGVERARAMNAHVTISEAARR